MNSSTATLKIHYRFNLILTALTAVALCFGVLPNHHQQQRLVTEVTNFSFLESHSSDQVNLLFFEQSNNILEREEKGNEEDGNSANVYHLSGFKAFTNSTFDFYYNESHTLSIPLYILFQSWKHFLS